MKTYRVKITHSALQDMEALYHYIAVHLHSPANAMQQYNRIADVIEGLNTMPKRFKLFGVEPWSSRGMHRMNVDHYAVFYYILEDAVVVTAVLYAASDLEKRLREGR